MAARTADVQEDARGTGGLTTRRAAAGGLGLAGLVLVVRSYGDGVQAAVASRFAGLALFVAALLTAFWPSTRTALSDLRRAARAAVAAERGHLLVLVVIVVIGAWVRARFAGQSMRFDESSIFLTYAIAPVDRALSQYPLPGNHLFHTFVQHMSWRVFGDGPLAVRLPALAAGIALIPAVYVAARSLYDRETGLLAAALTAASAPLVEYSVNGRGYTMVFLAVALLVPLTVYAVERRSPAGAVAWAVVAALGLYTIPVAIYGVGIVAAWAALLLLVGEPRAPRVPMLASLGATVALAFGLALLLYEPVLGQPGWDYDEAPVPPEFLKLIYETFHSGWPGPIWVALGIGVVAAAGLHLRIARHRAPLWLAALIVLPIAVALSPRVPPFTRSWLFVLPLYLIVASAGLVALARLGLRRFPDAFARAAAAVAVVAALALAATMGEDDLPYADDAPVRDADLVTRYLKEEHRPGDGLSLGRFAQPAFSYHFRREGFDPGPFTLGGEVVHARAAGGRRTLLVDTLTRGPGPKALGAENGRVIKRFRWAVVYEVVPR